jgi:hypothetical protein
MDPPHQHNAKPLTIGPKERFRDSPISPLPANVRALSGNDLGGAIMAHDEHKPVQELLDEALIGEKDD